MSSLSWVSFQMVDCALPMQDFVHASLHINWHSFLSPSALCALLLAWYHARPITCCKSRVLSLSSSLSLSLSTLLHTQSSQGVSFPLTLSLYGTLCCLLSHLISHLQTHFSSCSVSQHTLSRTHAHTLAHTHTSTHMRTGGWGGVGIKSRSSERSVT